MFSMMGMGDVDEDPIFGTMRQMDNIVNSMFSDPFSLMGGMMGGQRSLHPASNQGLHRSRGGGELMQFGTSPFGGMFGFPNMNRLFDNMSHMMTDPNCHSFSSSSVMTMSSGPDGRPQVYQASSTTRSAPGGIKETKKTVCDSRSGTKKMAIGHHIGNRAHIVEKEQNMFTGEQELRQDLLNLDEEEAPHFNREWEQKTGSVGVGAVTYGRDHRRNYEQLALPSTAPVSAPVSPSTTSVLRAKARAAARARKSHVSSPCRVEITEVTDDDNATSSSPVEDQRSASPIIEYPSASHSRKEGRNRDRYHARTHIREHNEGSRKRDHEEDYEEKWRHHKSRKPY